MSDFTVRECPTCGYSLSGLPFQGTCPECGKPYDVLTASGVVHRPRYGLGQLALPPAALLATGLIASYILEGGAMAMLVAAPVAIIWGIRVCDRCAAWWVYTRIKHDEDLRRERSHRLYVRWSGVFQLVEISLIILMCIVVPVVLAILAGA